MFVQNELMLELDTDDTLLGVEEETLERLERDDGVELDGELTELGVLLEIELLDCELTDDALDNEL